MTFHYGILFQNQKPQDHEEQKSFARRIFYILSNGLADSTAHDMVERLLKKLPPV